MIVKFADDRQGELMVLENLYRETEGTPAAGVIHGDILAIQRGQSGERDVIYHLESQYRNDPGVLLLNDLRIGPQDYPHQIDHVVLTRQGVAYVIETKNHRGRFWCESDGKAEGDGQWYVDYPGPGGKIRHTSIPSPVAQAQRNMQAVMDLFIGTETGLRRVKPVIAVRSDAKIDPELRNGRVPFIGVDRLPHWIADQAKVKEPEIEGRIGVKEPDPLNDEQLLGIAFRLIRAHQGNEDLRRRYGLRPVEVPKAAPASQSPQDDVAKRRSDHLRKYVGRFVRRNDLEVEGGLIAVRQHDDGMTTIKALTEDDDFKLHVSRCCKAAKGVWIDEDKAWLLPYEVSIEVSNRLRGKETPSPQVRESDAPVPDAPTRGESVLRRIPGNPRLHEADTPDGPVRFFQMPDGKYSVRTDGVELVDRRVEAVCSTGIGQWYAKYSNWILPDDRNLVERIAIQIAGIDIDDLDDTLRPRARQVDGRGRRRGDGQERPEKMQAGRA